MGAVGGALSASSAAESVRGACERLREAEALRQRARR